MLAVIKSSTAGAAGSLSAVAPPAPDLWAFLCRSKLRKIGILRNSPQINPKIAALGCFWVLFVLVVPVLVKYGSTFILVDIVGRLIAAVVVIVGDILKHRAGRHHCKEPRLQSVYLFAVLLYLA